MKTYKKRDFPVGNVRRYLEPGPTVLVTSAWKGEFNIMTMNWHTIMEFQPSLIGCMITAANYSFEMIRRSKECVINLPTSDLADVVVGIGNTTGAELDKFKYFDLTPEQATIVNAPLISECFANFECKVVDTRMLSKYNFFILEVVKAHVPARPKYPETIHYRGEGIFMLSGPELDLHKRFKKANL